MSNASFWIGIDLGTTNSTLTTFSASHEPSSILSEIRESIPQYNLQGEWQAEGLTSLPSFIYLPLPEELSANLWPHPTAPDATHLIGFHAAKRGAELPSRLISSAKSWLTHPLVDLTKPLLPLPLPSDEQFSLQEILQLQLAELRHAWLHNHPNFLFAQQIVAITVPASFDPRARQAVIAAALSVGFPEDLILLEEPLAAFYGWIAHHLDNWREFLKPGENLLVVDIGGGTSDFTLIGIKEVDGFLQMERTAVGEHLLLGGDNIDYALMVTLQEALEKNGPLDTFQLEQLRQAARHAKEVLFKDPALEKVDIVLPGKGAKLIKSSLKTILSQSQLQAIAVDGFFPLISYETPMSPLDGIGLTTQGLPYAHEPRITLQLLEFIRNHLPQGQVIHHLLLNGGTLFPQLIQERLLTQLNMWFSQLASGITLLSEANLFHAVSHGAAYYIAARELGGVRVKASLPKSYLIGVTEAAPAIPGVKPRIYAMVIAPKGMEEGVRLQLSEKIYQLRLGQEVEFRFFSGDSTDILGLSLGESTRQLALLKELPTISATISNDSLDQAKIPTVYVQLESHLDESGMLSLYLQEINNAASWKLHFNTRTLL